jgi:hypothetical protein
MFHSYIIAFISGLSLFIQSASGSDIRLEECGKVIGHEMGMWEFLSVEPSPKQVDRVLRSQLKFVKVSLQKLKDGVWVVDHNPTHKIILKHKLKQVRYTDLTWADIERFKATPGSFVPLYRLSDYIERDEGQLCWMFSPKVQIDESLIDEMKTLGIVDRSVILTGGLTDVQWLAELPKADDIHFAGRINDPSQIESYAPYLSRLWAMEIDGNKSMQTSIDLVHQAGVLAYVDSMGHSWNYEFLRTACRKVFNMNADFTQTNRPLQCMDLMGF